jgi:hypothetical protein
MKPTPAFDKPAPVTIPSLDSTASRKWDYRERPTVSAWSDRAICENDTDGFAKLVAKKDGTVF